VTGDFGRFVLCFDGRSRVGVELIDHLIEVVGETLPEIKVAKLESWWRVAIGDAANRLTQAVNRSGEPVAEFDSVEHERGKQKDHHQQERPLRPPQFFEMRAERNQRIAQHLQDEGDNRRGGEESEPMQYQAADQSALNLRVDERFLAIGGRHISPRGNELARERLSQT
jgi:hypothetical protein